jgi:2-amino-4-hydroxy-6-hydroxymethyldihydropteridine diphosphokinase
MSLSQAGPAQSNAPAVRGTREDDSDVSYAAFSLGANLGDRAAALTHAVNRLGALTGYHLQAVSEVFETVPVGGPEQPDYLNQVVVLRAEDPAGVAESDYRGEALLAVCHSIEADLDRVREERWGPRTLDVDILAMGQYTNGSADLTIPHPRLAERAFVLVPWAQIAADTYIPGLATVGALEQGLPSAERGSVRLWVATD